MLPVSVVELLVPTLAAGLACRHVDRFGARTSQWKASPPFRLGDLDQDCLQLILRRSIPLLIREARASFALGGTVDVMGSDYHE